MVLTPSDSLKTHKHKTGVSKRRTEGGADCGGRAGGPTCGPHSSASVFCIKKRKQTNPKAH